MVKEIPLTKGKVSLVDDEDYDKLIKHRWHANRNSVNNFYASRNIWDKEHRHTHAEYIHRVIMADQLTPETPEVDHINGNGLDNRRCNLRAVSRNRNRANVAKHSGSSKYKGVSFHKYSGKWSAVIQCNYHKEHIGLFISQEEAAYAYDNRARRLFGDCAVLNFPVGSELKFPPSNIKEEPDTIEITTSIRIKIGLKSVEVWI